MVCQMGCNYSKTKYEIMKQYQKDHNIFSLLPTLRSWDLKPLLDKAKPTFVDSSLDKP